MKIHLDAPPEEVQIQIIPLIDVIFCILVFFILAALQFTRQQAISIDLPRASTGSPLPGFGLGNTQFREMLVVTIGSTGQTFIDQKPVDRSQLTQALQSYILRNPNGMLVLNAPPSAFYNDVIQVLDQMRAVGGDRVALSTLPNTSQPPGSSPQPGTSPFPTTTPSFNPFDPFGTSPSPGTAPGQIPGATMNPLSPNGSASPPSRPSP
ncbi:MAG: biopolymer transporter ExbD [Leptolyngbyaceae cyanobacterium RU_5_1]|nr:biopolymer transporter ExbD [Leptolyngbyaceae cyanobacterium RU_5_1]